MHLLNSSWAESSELSTSGELSIHGDRDDLKRALEEAVYEYLKHYFLILFRNVFASLLLPLIFGARDT